MRTWADDFNTYEDACRYYGCDTPAQLAAEEEWERKQWAKEKTELEKEYGPYVDGVFYPANYVPVYFDRMPLSKRDEPRVPGDDHIPF